ncbi:plasmid mobilization protein [Maribellus maritimus]|uniref:plasmid mobilization protein n=1 Tax=Maribellus maritimus TaxID=2870838 RepID=UPI001EEB217F|nr:plasmid mobilization relaxosome protein MobC [Maribellus maritimus]MCG6191579.1 MobC family plasmid mobilization relaxosome protein [Maribellus maritimus]
MRPKTCDTEKLDKLICIRLSELEKKLLRKRCGKEGYRTISDFCRAKLVRKREIRKIEASEDFIRVTQKLDYELNKIGVNLNQVAKNLNTHQVYQFSGADREVFRQVLIELEKCFSILQQYMDKIEPR